MTNTFLEWDSYDSTRVTQLMVNVSGGHARRSEANGFLPLWAMVRRLARQLTESFELWMNMTLRPYSWVASLLRAYPDRWIEFFHLQILGSNGGCLHDIIRAHGGTSLKSILNSERRSEARCRLRLS
jgi:hypothetical protein